MRVWSVVCASSDRSFTSVPDGSSSSSSSGRLTGLMLTTNGVGREAATSTSLAALDPVSSRQFTIRYKQHSGPELNPTKSKVRLGYIVVCSKA